MRSRIERPAHSEESTAKSVGDRGLSRVEEVAFPHCDASRARHRRRRHPWRSKRGRPDWPPASVIYRGGDEPNLRVADLLVFDDPERFDVVVVSSARRPTFPAWSQTSGTNPGLRGYATASSWSRWVSQCAVTRRTYQLASVYDIRGTGTPPRFPWRAATPSASALLAVEVNSLCSLRVHQPSARPSTPRSRRSCWIASRAE